jgi:hypothetical protein
MFILRGSLERHGTWRVLQSPGHAVLLALAAVSGATLVVVYQRLALLLLAAIAAILFGAHRLLMRRHAANGPEKRSLPAELVGVALLTLTAPAARIAQAGSVDAIGGKLWLLNLLFFCGGVLYVKYRVRGVLAHHSFDRLAERMRFAGPVLAYHLLLVVFLIGLLRGGAIPALAAAAFAPATLRAGALVVELGKRFPIKRLGWSEVAHAVFFAMALLAGFR